MLLSVTVVLLLLNRLVLSDDIPSWEQREDWVDPMDVHSYDHKTKNMRTTLTPRVSQSSTLGPEPCGSSMQQPLECKQKLSASTTCLSLELFLQRQTSLLLRIANLIEPIDDPGLFSIPVVLMCGHYCTLSEEDDKTMMSRLLRVTLNGKQLRELQRVSVEGEIDVDRLNAIWSVVLSAEQEPDYSVWDSLATLLPRMPSISMQSFFLLTNVIYILAICAMLLLGVPVRIVLLIALLLLVMLSTCMNAMRNYQAILARQTQEYVDPSSLPRECRPPVLRSWWDAIVLFRYSPKELTFICDQYYKREHTSPELHVTPLEMVTQVIMNVVQEISRGSGNALNDFCSATFNDLPWFLGPIVCAIFKLLLVLIPIAMFCICIWMCIFQPTLFFRRISQQQQQQNAPIQQPPTQPVQIHAHVHINTGGQTPPVMMLGPQGDVTSMITNPQIAPEPSGSLNERPVLLPSEEVPSATCNDSLRPRSNPIPPPSTIVDPPVQPSVLPVVHENINVEDSLCSSNDIVDMKDHTSISRSHSSSTEPSNLRRRQSRKENYGPSKDLERDSLQLKTPYAVTEQKNEKPENESCSPKVAYSVSQASSIIPASPVSSSCNQEREDETEELNTTDKAATDSSTNELTSCINEYIESQYPAAPLGKLSEVSGHITFESESKELSTADAQQLMSSEQSSMDASDVSLSPMRSELSEFIDSLHLDYSSVISNNSEDSFDIIDYES